MRNASQDIKRRKMREDLEAREKTVATARSEESKARSRLKVCPPFSPPSTEGPDFEVGSLNPCLYERHCDIIKSRYSSLSSAGSLAEGILMYLIPRVSNFFQLQDGRWRRRG